MLRVVVPHCAGGAVALASREEVLYWRTKAIRFSRAGCTACCGTGSGERSGRATVADAAGQGLEEGVVLEIRT
jgi:hypothetical protein